MSKKTSNYKWLALAGLFLASTAFADGLKISNVSIAPRDAKTATVTFDIAWTNAYRYDSFHDAAWVFFKVRPDTKSPWQHARLVADKVVNPTGYSSGEGTPLEFVVPGGDEGFVGMFVRLAKDCRGAVTSQKVTAVINLNPEPRTLPPEIRAFGIEMAYVAEGPFYLGSSVRRINCFYAYQESGTNTPPYRVTGAGTIPTGKQKGKLWALGFRPEDNSQIPAAFPNGYAAFYCMKFPCLTQGFYADFLNTLTVAQAKKRWYVEGQGKEIKQVGTAVPAVRGRSEEASSPTFAATAPDARTAWLSWEDYAMVAAWAGLRPLTELEFEKAVRGLDAPEGTDAGLSFYGLQEVNAGNIYERQVTVSTAEGRKFAGTHGRGIVELPLDWPSAVKDGVVYRGNYFRYRKYCTVGHLGTAGRSADCNGKSDRFSASHEGQDELIAGCRIARTAPAGDTIAAAGLAARFDATVVRPLVRLTAPVKVDTLTEGLGKPMAVLGTTETLFPVNSRLLMKLQERVLWNGPADLSGKVYLAWDGEALLVGAEVTDDLQLNVQSGGSLWNGDALQFGVVTPKGMHWNLAAALTTNGVAVHQFIGGSDALFKTMDCSVTRDDKTNITRYGVRLPLAALGLVPGDTFGFNALICDGDDNKGMRHNMRLTEGISYPFRTELYPRFVLAK
jgi:hypothetical protein